MYQDRMLFRRRHRNLRDRTQWQWRSMADHHALVVQLVTFTPSTFVPSSDSPTYPPIDNNNNNMYLNTKLRYSELRYSKRQCRQHGVVDQKQSVMTLLYDDIDNNCKKIDTKIIYLYEWTKLLVTLFYYFNNNKNRWRSAIHCTVGYKWVTVMVGVKFDFNGIL